MATRVIPGFIVSKSSLDETISEIVLPHFCKDPVFFQTCLNYISLKHYGLKMQGKWDVTSDTKCYDAITCK